MLTKIKIIVQHEGEEEKLNLSLEFKFKDIGKFSVIPSLQVFSLYTLVTGASFNRKKMHMKK